MKIPASYVRDALAGAGLLLLTVGGWLEFGPGWAAIIAGAIILSLAVAAAVRSS